VAFAGRKDKAKRVRSRRYGCFRISESSGAAKFNPCAHKFVLRKLCITGSNTFAAYWTVPRQLGEEEAEGEYQPAS
jgi:hypothetical protein